MNITLRQLIAVALLNSASTYSLAEGASYVQNNHNHNHHRGYGDHNKGDKGRHHDRLLINELKKQLQEVAKTKNIEQRNLTNFDDLDFNVFSNQKWDELGRSHHQNIIVHWPDGRVTTGIDTHIADLKLMFAYAPDTRITEHPISIASGDLTAVYGFIEGTFTQPMITPDGKTIAPTGKSYKLAMITIGHWTKDGVMDEEWLQWDNQSFMKQLGLAE